MEHERLFRRFGGNPAPTMLGQKQFFDQQSRGIKPVRPDSYYLALTEGKRRFDWLCSEYRQMYLMGEWWGFYRLWEDWEGERWVLPHLCAWYPRQTGRELPEWLDKEMSREELDTYLRGE